LPFVANANATLLDAIGTPPATVQALLGYSSSEITREIYLHSGPHRCMGGGGKS